jgi:dTDP-D-glucose 4,6-dehydratase
MARVRVLYLWNREKILIGKIGEIYNIGCDEGMEYSIMDVVQLLIKKSVYRRLRQMDYVYRR